MATPRSTSFTKNPLFSLNPNNCTAIQGVANQPLYKRFNELENIVNRYSNDSRFNGFFAEPIDNGGVLTWYAEKGEEDPIQLSELQGVERQQYNNIKIAALAHFKQLALQLRNNPATKREAEYLQGALCFVDEPYMEKFFFCYNQRVVMGLWGMKLKDERGVTMVSTIKTQERRAYTVNFVTQGEGTLSEPHQLTRMHGWCLKQNEIPTPTPAEGWQFIGWAPDLPLNHRMEGDCTFIAKFEGSTPVVETPPETPPVETPPVMHHVTFVAGQGGFLQGENEFLIPHGNILPGPIPLVNAHTGYTFKGWDYPLNLPITQDVTIKAVYDHESWWKRNLKWLLWLLMLILLGLLAYFLLRSCKGCHVGSLFGGDDSAIVDPDRGGDSDSGDSDPSWDEYDPGEYDNSDGGDYGRVYEPGDGGSGDFFDEDEIPGHGVIAPIDEDLPIGEDEDGNEIVKNRLNLFFENEDVDYKAFENDFKKVYPDAQYKIVGFDPNAGLVSIEIPESKRDEVRDNINDKLSKYKFFVVDENIVGIPKQDLSNRGSMSDYDMPHGWHLQAIHAPAAWKITKGAGIVVAVVDNTFHINRPEFKGRVFRPYNVYSQTPKFTPEEVDHGTHVAGTIAAQTADPTMSGVAPECKIMPVQVAQNGVMTTSAIVCGIMYAIHQGADVVNISLGMYVPDAVKAMPAEQQREIIRQNFKNEEWVWTRVTAIAQKKNATLVWAAGNDNVLTDIDPKHRPDYCINVTACDGNGKVKFSNYADGSTLAAPGVAIYATYGPSGYESLDGTSMAAPIVSGCVALLKSKNKKLTASQLSKLLVDTGKPMSGNIGRMVQIDQALTGKVSAGGSDDSSKPRATEGRTPKASEGKTPIVEEDTDADIDRRIRELEKEIQRLRQQKKKK